MLGDIGISLFLLGLIASGAHCSGRRRLKGSFEEGTVYAVQDEVLNADESEVTIQLDLPPNSDLVPKVSTYSEDGTLDVSVRHSTGKSLIWRNEPGFKISRYICHSESDSFLLITVSTFSDSDISFNLEASLEDISIKVDEEISTTVDSGSPIVRKFIIPPEWEGMDNFLTIAVQSNCSDCGLLGIQPFTCPFFDVESSMVFRAKWQAYMGLSAINVRTSDPKFSDGFYIILITKTNSELCDTGASSNLEEDLRVKVSKPLSLTIHQDDYYPFGTSIGIVFAYLIIYGFGIAFTLFSSMPVEGKVAIKIRPKRNQGNKTRRSVEDGEVDERKSLDYVDSVPSPPNGSPTKVNRSTSTVELNPTKIREIIIIDKEELQKYVIRRI
eukprot:TRINITY_DN25552_c0_g1_i1.p1 TRINITY_DN25552_c0_g1~~TRINITY_DN25552_c0_g1_i1.p1  ORF type:complete len:384 (+),score=79.02 TRINITY_DN25552_c0_g1_i1:98-1249(+)